MRVDWFKGHLAPPESGEYYIAIEAQEDNATFKKGEVEITSDYYSVERGEWDTLGKDNTSWKVLCWADIPKPDIPWNTKGRIRVYFGKTFKNPQ